MPKDDDLLNESVIKEVKKYEFIYNNAHPDHGKRLPTLETWTAIASAVGDTVQQCKNRWFVLRKRYEIEYLKMMSDNAMEECKSKWKYARAMTFLRGYVGPNQNFLHRLSKMSKRDAFCRACLCPLVHSSDELVPTSYNIFNAENFDEKFMQCTNLKSVPWDEYPHSVCEQCYTKVLDFYQFQCMSRDSLDKFKVMLENQIELKCETGEEATSDNRLHFASEYTDIKYVSAGEQLAENSSVSTEETQFFNELPETQTSSACESGIQDTCGVDPLAEHINTDSDWEEKIAVVENPICKEVLPKRSTRMKKTQEKEENIAKVKKNQLEVVRRKSAPSKKKLLKSAEEDELENTADDDGDADYDDGAFEDQSDDESSISDDSEKSDAKEKMLSKVSLKCDICPQTFRFPHRLEAHQRRHKGLQGYPCTFENCDRAYNRLDDLRNHLNDHNGIPNVYKCSIENCNMVYKCFSGLNKHKRKNHKCGKELKTYPCETCGKVLTNPRSLTGHRFIHLDKSQWPYVCDEKDCTRRFRLMSQLTIHKKRHAGIKNYVCPHCGVRKTTCTELKIHINFHTFEQKYPCGFCPKVFKSVGMMRTHINRVHEGKKPANDTIFACRFCDRRFSSLQSKKYHEMTHTGERPYACQECGKTFTYPSGLASHKNMHLKGENPYVCDECGRRFKWPSALKSHMKLHLEGAKPYSCEECGKGFRWPGSYYKHKKTHARQDAETVEEEGDDVKEDATEPAPEPEPEPSSLKYEITYLQYTTIDLDTNKII